MHLYSIFLLEAAPEPISKPTLIYFTVHHFPKSIPNHRAKLKSVPGETGQYMYALDPLVDKILI